MSLMRNSRLNSRSINPLGCWYCSSTHRRHRKSTSAERHQWHNWLERVRPACYSGVLRFNGVYQALTGQCSTLSGYSMREIAAEDFSQHSLRRNFQLSRNSTVHSFTFVSIQLIPSPHPCTRPQLVKSADVPTLRHHFPSTFSVEVIYFGRFELKFSVVISCSCASINPTINPTLP